MFYDIFKKLCDSNNTSPNAVCLKLGFSNATAPYWKKSGGTPKIEALEKIANYFGVTVDYLLGKEEIKSNSGTVFSESIPEDPKLSKAVALISSLNDLGQDVAIQRLEELNEIGKYKQDDDNSDGKCSILFILITAAFMMLLQLIG